MSIELTLLRNLVTNEEFSRRVLPFIQDEYFSETPHKVLFNEIKKYTLEYNSLPTKETISIGVDELTNLSQKDYYGIHPYYRW